MRNLIDLTSQTWMFSNSLTDLPVSLPASDENWKKVTLPHTWNAVDGMIGVPFSRGAHWYVTTFEAPSQPTEEGRTYVEVGACGLRGAGVDRACIEDMGGKQEDGKEHDTPFTVMHDRIHND